MAWTLIEFKGEALAELREYAAGVSYALTVAIDDNFGNPRVVFKPDNHSWSNDVKEAVIRNEP